MPNFTFTAINELGRTVRGRMVAENEMDLEERLRQDKLDLVSCNIKQKRRASSRSKVKSQDLILMCMHLEQLERAGVPLHEALSDIRDSTESVKLREIMVDVCEKVKNGMLLSDALNTYSGVFNNVFVGLIKTGEKTGNLGSSFMHLGNHMKWVSEIRRKIKKATRYPMMLGVVLCGVITMMMLFVVPQMIEFIAAQGFEIPPHTQALIFVSGAFEEFWYIILGAPVAAYILLKIFYAKSEVFAYRADRLFLYAPIFGQIIRKIEIARFTHFFAVMFNSGIDILDSLQAARDVVKNRIIKESITEARQSVTEGNTLTSSLKKTGQFPNLVIRMFKVGEDSGNMKEALDNINFFYDREVDDAVEGLLGMIQPALTVVMGAIIFWIIASVFGPLYSSFEDMNI